LQPSCWQADAATERNYGMTTADSANQEMAEALIASLETDASIKAVARLNNLA
jgi:hypothetical protein